MHLWVRRLSKGVSMSDNVASLARKHSYFGALDRDFLLHMKSAVAMAAAAIPMKIGTVNSSGDSLPSLLFCPLVGPCSNDNDQVS